MSRSKVRIFLGAVVVIAAVALAMVAVSAALQGLGYTALIIGVMFVICVGAGTALFWITTMLTRPDGYPEKINWTLRWLPRQYIRIDEITFFRRLPEKDLAAKVAQWEQEFNAKPRPPS